jgi:CheY-like chemotaxis protein
MKKTDICLILMDCNMAIKNGYTTTSNIREYLHLHKIKQPIITAVTGHSEHKYTKLAFKSGMNSILSKPSNLEILKDLLI